MKSSPYKDNKDFPDGLDILCCKILVWDVSEDMPAITQGGADPDERKCLVLRECSEIEISDTYKQLISSATVKFPRGTIVHRPVLNVNNNDLQNGEEERVYTEIMPNGTIATRRNNTSLLAPTDFKPNQRIRIYLGMWRYDSNKYFATEKERIAWMDSICKEGGPMFDGYIRKCSVATPVELKCENLAAALKRKNCCTTEITTGEKCTVKDILYTKEEGGKYGLLQGTGLKLHPDTLAEETIVGKIKIYPDETVADILSTWSKNKLYCFIRNDNDGNPCIKVGRSYISTQTANSVVKNEPIAQIHFNYHVAQDNLTLMNSDPSLLAVEAKCHIKSNSPDGKMYKITLRLNPDWTGPSDTTHKKFQYLNESKVSKKELENGRIIKDNAAGVKVDLTMYTVVPFMSTKLNWDFSKKSEHEAFLAEARAYFEGYHLNGVDGSLTLFGDLKLQSGQKVELLDKRAPEKNGWYIVDEVVTKFGTSGFRQTIKIPYCIAKPKNE